MTIIGRAADLQARIEAAARAAAQRLGPIRDNLTTDYRDGLLSGLMVGALAGVAIGLLWRLS